MKNIVSCMLLSLGAIAGNVHAGCCRSRPLLGQAQIAQERTPPTE